MNRQEQISQPGSKYRFYALICLFAVYVFNFLDRQIISILAEEIKADLDISDAQIGFLYGTAFALFYAVFGIPLARLADVWSRKNLIAIGMTFWTLMTVTSGFMRNLTGLALCRFGVGIGEASASPASSSLLADYFPPRLRATAISFYSSGSYVGSGLGVMLGGLIVTQWQGWFPSRIEAPLGLAGWQVAFLAAGLPGLLIALWVYSLVEPKRGEQKAGGTVSLLGALRVLGEELSTIVPPITVYGLIRAGGKRADVLINLAIAGSIAAIAILVSMVTRNPLQWGAVAIGLYAAASWVQSLSLRDPGAFKGIFQSRSVLLVLFGFGLTSLVSYGTGFWFPSYIVRNFETNAAEVGATYGLCVVTGGFLGVTFGGVCADYFYRKFPAGRLIVGLASILLTIPLTLLAVEMDSLSIAYIFIFGQCFVGPIWLGICFSSLVDLVPANLRATSIAVSILFNTLIGLSVGPAFIGQISDLLVAGGASSGSALGDGIKWSMMFSVLSAVLIWMAIRQVTQSAASGNGAADSG